MACDLLQGLLRGDLDLVLMADELLQYLFDGGNGLTIKSCSTLELGLRISCHAVTIDLNVQRG